MKWTGLSEAEVAARTRAGEVNDAREKSSRSVAEILRENIFTPFNALMTVMAATVLAVGGGPANALFFGIMLVNMAIGIGEELHAKRTLDKIMILHAPKVTVIREGELREIPVREVVRGDFISLKLGDQIVADGEILESASLEIDESLLTGESDPVVKKAKNKVLSGAIVVAGAGVMSATAVGEASYSARLTAEAKQFRAATSEIQASINKLIRWISLSLVVVAPIFIWGQLRVHGDPGVAIVRAIAAIVGLIPNGFVMLTSLAFMLAAVTLLRKKVLIQQMPAVETLARVDTLLLDKTGTLTEGGMRLERDIFFDPARENETKIALKTLASRNSAPTNLAIAAAYKSAKTAKFTREIAFSSARKFSAIAIENRNYVLGAPEILLADPGFSRELGQAKKFARTGKRVLILCENAAIFDAKNSQNLAQTFAKNRPLAMIILSEKIRENARETLEFFAQQDVDAKIISGDSTETVAAIARVCGFENVHEFDARKLPQIEPEIEKKLVALNAKFATKNPKSRKIKLSESSEKFAEIVKSHNVFGRVKPEQKRLIVAILQLGGKVVGMTGDGVNDALALKKADLGIAMESGSAASKSVAEIVLLDNDFAHLPDVLAEGRRVMANIERVANLFIAKNVYVLILGLLTTIFAMPYPYVPSQMTVVDAFTIGIPSFFLALAPNSQKYRPGFLGRILRFAAPVGGLVALALMANYALVTHRGVSLEAAGASTAIVAMMAFLAILITLARPFRFWKIALLAFSVGGFLAILLSPLGRIFHYSLNFSTIKTALFVGGAAMIAVAAVDFANRKNAQKSADS